MATLEENIARAALQRLRSVVPALNQRESDLRSELAMYDSPLWPPFAEGMEREFTDTLFRLIDAEDYAETRALQRIAQRLRERLARPDKARDELQEVLNDIEQERQTLRTAAGLPLGATGEGAADRLNGR